MIGGAMLRLTETIKAYQANDPAARNGLSILLLYNGLHATISYRIANWFYRHGMIFLARWISQHACAACSPGPAPFFVLPCSRGSTRRAARP